jgi:hypothetical protein
MLASESAFAGVQSLTAGITSGSLMPSQSYLTPPTNTGFWQDWGTAHYTFVPTATSATLQFSVTNQEFDVGLDAVSIAPGVATTPEPGSMILFATGLIGVAGRILRHRRG